MESKTSDRKYQTWFEQVQVAFSQIGATVSIKSLVSDRALALIQLAEQGLGCPSLPDLFHGMRCLSRSIGARLGGQLARTKRQFIQTNREITARHLKKKPISLTLNQRQARLQESDLEVLTIIHNFDLRRADGSTAAQRFFGRTFPELFPWLIEKMGDLPSPSQPRKLVNLTPAI